MRGVVTMQNPTRNQLLFNQEREPLYLIDHHTPNVREMITSLAGAHLCLHMTTQYAECENRNDRVVYIPSGQPIIIIDERRNKSAGDPVFIRNGVVVQGDPNYTRYTHPDAERTILRSTGGSSSPRELDQGHRHHSNRESPTRQPLVVHSDKPTLHDRIHTWGHKHPVAPPFLHFPHRCHSNYHGLKDQWLGLLTRGKERRERGRRERAYAKQERMEERERRKAIMRDEGRAIRRGDKNVMYSVS